VIELILLFAQASAQEPLVRGEKIFATSCAVGYCHGQGGAANRGPRLKGRGFSREYLEKVVRNGIPNTGMPGFADRLKRDELEAVIAYVVSISSASEGPSSATSGETPRPIAATPADSNAPPEIVPPSVPEEHRRGRDLFFDALRGIRCGSCHQVVGHGVNVADMRSGIVVQATAGADQFPAVMVEETPAVTRLYDVTSAPPVLRTFRKDEVKIDSKPVDFARRHAAFTSGYSSSEMDAIRGFVGWARNQR
jgi:mono/diheme cytochrome c family protein